jgi:hypothetical protein
MRRSSDFTLYHTSPWGPRARVFALAVPVLAPITGDHWKIRTFGARCAAALPNTLPHGFASK